MKKQFKYKVLIDRSRSKILGGFWKAHITHNIFFIQSCYSEYFNIFISDPFLFIKNFKGLQIYRLRHYLWKRSKIIKNNYKYIEEACFNLSSQSQLNLKFQFIVLESKALKDYKININEICKISTNKLNMFWSDNREQINFWGTCWQYKNSVSNELFLL